jgi:hypothetical protein
MFHGAVPHFAPVRLKADTTFADATFVASGFSRTSATAVVSRLSLLIGLVLISVGLLAPTISG